MSLTRLESMLSPKLPNCSLQKLATGEIEVSIPVSGPLFTPYASAWNEDVTIRSKPFDEFPWELDASSSSGAPALEAGGWVLGFLEPNIGRISWDGSRLALIGPADSLFAQPVAEGAWQLYCEASGFTPPQAPWGLVPEYCTWVEQVARRTNEPLPGEILSEALVDEILDVIDTENWPRGRFTVDEGWAPRHGPGGYGTWEPRSDFDPAVVADKIAQRGHVPGLWLAPALLSPESKKAVESPQLAGPNVSMPGETPWNAFHFLNPGEESQDLINGLFRRAWDWGYRKLKLDIFYGCRQTMRELSRQCRVASDRLPGAMELEGHIPDPFIARYYDVVRLNDVLISSQHPDWKVVADSHDRVCEVSCPGQILCLDHIGGNHPKVDASGFQEHIRWMETRLDRGYPVVGLLPSRLDAETVKRTGELLAASVRAEKERAGKEGATR